MNLLIRLAFASRFTRKGQLFVNRMCKVALLQRRMHSAYRRAEHSQGDSDQHDYTGRHGQDTVEIDG